MKFGDTLKLEVLNHPEWDKAKVIDYDKLKMMIKFLGNLSDTQEVRDEEKKFVPASLSFDPTGTMPEKVAMPTQVDNAGTSSQAAMQETSAFQEIQETDFFDELDRQIERIGEVTNKTLDELDKRMDVVQQDTERGWDSEEERLDIKERAEAIGKEFVSLEHFVNLNYTALYKILKKHDKRLPATPIYQFYRKRLYQQHWVQGDYSRMFVKLSAVHSALRGDQSGKQDKGAAQGFVRSTKKYWIRGEDVTAVKYAILQHLPVFQMKIEELKGDSQLTNSVYLDNDSLELYHGRLEKYPGAIAMRYRWYGDGDPTAQNLPVFVERKTHKESWKGEMSVKERFALKPDQVVPFAKGEYTVEQAVNDLKAKKPGMKEADIQSFTQLFTECQQQIIGKKLEPCMRTQYMRVAYQIPFDATVRISLDTNLCMFKENPDGQPTCVEAGQWYRDPAHPPKRTEVTRFPHGVLEVKLSLPEGEECPRWVDELVERSGYLTLVHKMSKFIHGCAVLLPDQVMAMPYWIDDVSLRASILHSQPEDRNRLAHRVVAQADGIGPSTAINVGDLQGQLREPLLNPMKNVVTVGPTTNLANVPYTDSVKFSAEEMAMLLNENGQSGGAGLGTRIAGWWRSALCALGLRKPNDRTIAPYMLPRKIPMRIEPKTLLANERTLLNWVGIAVHLGAIGTALVGFSIGLSTTQANQSLARPVQLIAVFIMPVSVLMVMYAAWVFFHRVDKIRKKEDGNFDDRIGPIALSSVVVIALWGTFIAAVVQVAGSV